MNFISRVRNALANPRKLFTGKHVYHPRPAYASLHHHKAGMLIYDFADHTRLFPYGTKMCLNVWPE